MCLPIGFSVPATFRHRSSADQQGHQDRSDMIAGAVAFPATGIDLTALTVFRVLSGVGSASDCRRSVQFHFRIIILLTVDQAGDTITLGDTSGPSATSVTVSCRHYRDGKEYLIPMRTSISQQVVNWSFFQRRPDRCRFRHVLRQHPHECTDRLGTAWSVPASSMPTRRRSAG